MSKQIKDKMYKDSRLIRYITGEQMFEKRRQVNTNQLSYLEYYGEQSRIAIMKSLHQTIPQVLPNLNHQTISYYRRTNQPIYKVKNSEDTQFDPHMLYESLWILAALQEINFSSNYQKIAKQFENDLHNYMESPYEQIREMAIVVAGNRIIGRQSDILEIVKRDPKQMWVLINHIYERKIHFENLYGYLNSDNQIIYRSIFEMSNNKDDEIIQSLIKDKTILGKIIQALNHSNNEITLYAIRIIGNILAEKQQYAYILYDFGILDYFFNLLMRNDENTRKQACWALSNFAFEKGPATYIVHHFKLIQKLILLFKQESNCKTRVQLTHIFSNLTTFAEKIQIFKLLIQENFLDQCLKYLNSQDPQLDLVVLYFINEMIPLAEHFNDGEGNLISLKIKQCGLKQIISVKSYNQDYQISSLAQQILEKIPQDE